MPVFYIAEPGFDVLVKESRLCLERDEEIVYEAPIRRCEGLVVFGQVEIRRTAIDTLLKSGRPIAYLNYAGDLLGMALPTADRAVENRLLQAVAVADPTRRLALAKILTARKLHAMAAVSAERLWNRPNRTDQSRIARIKAAALDCAIASSLDELRGMEGRATRHYYATLSNALRPPFRFEHRVRRPPTDPFNALLSLGGVLLSYEAVAAIIARGLDPYLGFVHASGRGHPALALDLLEPLRPAVVDRWALRLLNLGMIRETDFEKREAGGVYLAGGESRKVALREWRKLMDVPVMSGVGGKAKSARTALGHYCLELVRELRVNQNPT